MLSEEQRIAICFLATPGIGRQTFRKAEQELKQSQISWRELWEGNSVWSKIGLTENQQTSLKNFQTKFSVASYFEYLAKKDIRVIYFGNKNYPELLNKIEDPPLALYIKGTYPEQNLSPISVIGSRKMTSYGRLATQKIVAELVELGGMIVSGFMYGVDFLAHQTALEKGGQTVGVLGFGFEHFYPSVFEKKYQEMLAQGMCFVSEYAPFVRPKQGSFPERNRIVAGLSLGTVVIEAGEKSGTLITSRLAGEFGRGVFAVPGSIFSPYSLGTRSLLNQGACLVGSGAEIFSELNLPVGGLDRFVWLGEKIHQLGGEIIEELKMGPLDFARLSQISKLSTADLNATLCQLEISGAITRQGEVWTIKL